VVGLVDVAKKVGFTFKSKRLLQDFRKRTRMWGRAEIPLRAIGQYITEVSKQSFDNEDDPATGAAWPSLSPAYVAYKKRQRRSRGMLVFRGHLKRSVGYSITIPRVIIGPAVHYGIYHQFGAKGMSLGRSGGSAQSLPARPFLGIGPTHERELQGIVARFVAGGK
jgi:phage virion morphogenesis protein